MTQARQEPSCVPEFGIGATCPYSCTQAWRVLLPGTASKSQALRCRVCWVEPQKSPYEDSRESHQMGPSMTSLRHHTLGACQRLALGPFAHSLYYHGKPTRVLVGTREIEIWGNTEARRRNQERDSAHRCPWIGTLPPSHQWRCTTRLQRPNDGKTRNPEKGHEGEKNCAPAFWKLIWGDLAVPSNSINRDALRLPRRFPVAHGTSQAVMGSVGSLGIGHQREAELCFLFVLPHVSPNCQRQLGAAHEPNIPRRWPERRQFVLGTN
ncbi:hypothetical protein VTK26DRAFT_2556 [Humicola hyalothermophila]